MLPLPIKPIKRSTELAPLSREHHEALLLAWKIRAGIRKGISCERIINYCLWFYAEHMVDHFRCEEESFPKLINTQDPLLLQMQEEHKLIKAASVALSHKDENCTDRLEEFAMLVVNHVRFEERLLYNHIEKVATGEQLRTISHNISQHKVSKWKDFFWLY